jgi:signal transduction histidine kinase
MLFAAVFIPAELHAQSRRFGNINSAQGLSQNTVNCVLQDSEGLLWFGTQNGLNCWDGYSFKIYRFNRNDTNSIPDNFILTLAETDTHFIAVGTRNGFACLDKRTGVFKRAVVSGAVNNSLHETVAVIIPDSNGQFYFLQRKSTWVYETRSGKTRAVPDVLSQVRNIMTDPKTGKSYGFSPSGVFRFDLKTGRKGRVYNFRNETWLNTQTGTLSGSHIYVLDEGQLYQVNTGIYNNGRYCGFIPEKPTCMAAAPDSSIWIGTLNGLYIFHPEDNRLEHITVAPNTTGGLSSNRIMSLYASPDGLMWVGNTENGVDVYDNSISGKTIETIFSNTTTGQTVWSTVQLKQGQLFGTTGGIRFQSYRNATSPAWLEQLPRDVFAASMCFDQQNRLWLATRNRGVLLLDTLKRELLSFKINRTESLPNAAYHVQCDREGTVWVATADGIWYCNNASRELKNKPIFYIANDTLNYTTSTFEDSKGRLWVGSNHGVSVSDPQKKTFRQYTYEAGNPKSISHPIISWIAEDAHGVIWLGSFGGGLNRYHATTDGFTAVGIAAGLPDEVVYVVAPDQQNRLWLTTDRGLVCYDPQTQKLFTFTTRDGLRSNEFVQNGFYRDDAGRFYFANGNGFVRVDASHAGWPVFAGRPVITGLKINNADFPRSSGVLQLQPGERDIAVSFAAVNYRFQERIAYSYKLEGYDTAWIEPPAGIRFASYTNLPYGDYTLRIRCRIAGGDWSPNEQRLQLHIRTPFWRTTWFLLLLVVAAAGLIAGISWFIAGYRHRRRMRAAELQRKIHLERERISRDLHDHLGAQISYFISTADFIAFGLDQHTPEQSRKLLQELSQGGRTTMQELRETIWALNKAAYTASEFAERLRTYFSMQLASDPLQWKLTVEGNAATVLQPALLLNTFRIIQEALSNVKKHAEAENFRVALQLTENEFSVSISDDGKGFAFKNSPEGHYGLDNMQLRATETGGTLSITSEPGKGTTLLFKAPLSE